MGEYFKIFVDQLRHGRVEKIEEQIPPDFLDVNEEELAFNHPVQLKGEAYLAENELILHWDAETIATIPCSICNQPVQVKVRLTNFYHSEPLAEIKAGIYHFKSLLRESILLETPFFAECEGSCPKREEYNHYLKQSSNHEIEERHNPFADLDWK
jgi:uncharacterized metal-binding protein YceD (DUF177 family)